MESIQLCSLPIELSASSIVTTEHFRFMLPFCDFYLKNSRKHRVLSLNADRSHGSRIVSFDRRPSFCFRSRNSFRSVGTDGRVEPAGGSSSSPSRSGRVRCGTSRTPSVRRRDERDVGRASCPSCRDACRASCPPWSSTLTWREPELVRRPLGCETSPRRPRCVDAPLPCPGRRTRTRHQRGAVRRRRRTGTWTDKIQTWV